MREEDITALFDLDGTLCDHDKALHRDYNLIKSPEDAPFRPFDYSTPDYVNQRIKLIRNQPGWWENLERFQLGFDIFGLVKELGYHIEILSKAPNNSKNAMIEKTRWVKKNVGESFVVRIVPDKSIFDGRILVDDYPENLSCWLENRPKSVGIMPAHEYNHDFKHDQVTRYNGSNIEEVRRILEIARNLRANP